MNITSQPPASAPAACKPKKANSVTTASARKSTSQIMVRNVDCTEVRLRWRDEPALT